MENTKQLADLNDETLKRLEEYMEAKGGAGTEHHEKINSAKEKWQSAWNEFLETLVVLERLEI